MPRTRTALLVSGALLVGLVAGCTGGVASSGTTSATASEPAPTVTVTSTATETVDTGGVPAACLTALDIGETALGASGEALQLTGSLLSETVPAVITAVSVGDVATVDEQTEVVLSASDRLDLLAGQIDADGYNAAAQACRAAA